MSSALQFVFCAAIFIFLLKSSRAFCFYSLPGSSGTHAQLSSLTVQSTPLQSGWLFVILVAHRPPCRRGRHLVYVFVVVTKTPCVYMSQTCYLIFVVVVVVFSHVCCLRLSWPYLANRKRTLLATNILIISHGQKSKST